jgi:NAD(P)-dependent dehydrogenase (short-subunit alcohol dehydrogenase family)
MAETRTALVSGGNRGIGFEVVRQLARLGILVAIGSRDPDKGQAAAAELASEGLEPAVVPLDVTDEASVRDAVAQTRHLFGRIDILVNNAAILLERSANGTAGSVVDVSIEKVVTSFDVNTLGPLRTMQAVLPYMQDEGYGRIVNVSSGLGQLSDMGSGHTAYRLSKAALNALTRTAAADCGKDSIKINAVCPGWVQTDMGGVGATRSPEEGAETVVWLATLDAEGPTGGFFRDKKPIPW